MAATPNLHQNNDMPERAKGRQDYGAAPGKSTAALWTRSLSEKRGSWPVDNYGIV
jgi:hypothetical protein